MRVWVSYRTTVCGRGRAETTYFALSRVSLAWSSAVCRAGDRPDIAGRKKAPQGLGFQPSSWPSFALPQIRSRRYDILPGTEAGPQQSVGVKSLEPLRAVDVGLAARYVARIAGVDQNHVETVRLKDFKRRNLVHAG